MNKNILKLLAALTMVIYHAGLLLFPQAAVLRWIGRISFPLFAFCVGDGCVHTRKPGVYFWRVLGLGLACQIVFAAEELLGGGTLRGSQALYLNILFTLALAILLCTSFLRLQRQPNGGARPVLNAFVDEVAKRHLENVVVTQTGCIGMCQFEPIVEVFVPGKDKVTYGKVSPEKVARIVADHIVNGNPIAEFTVGNMMK